MSWFHIVNQGFNQQQQCPFDNHSLPATDDPCSGLNLSLSGPTEVSPTMPYRHSAPTPEDFPSAPQGAGSPYMLERPSCLSPIAGQVSDPEPISYVSLQEQRCVLSWFQGWNATQRGRFLQDLLGKAVPGKVCTLLNSLSTLQVFRAFPSFNLI